MLSSGVNGLLKFGPHVVFPICVIRLLECASGLIKCYPRMECIVSLFARLLAGLFGVAGTDLCSLTRTHLLI